MKTLLTICVVLFATAALAQGWVAYPPEVCGMTDAQFCAWAAAKNTQLKIEWEARKAAARADQPQYLQGSVTTTRNDWTTPGQCSGGNGDYNPGCVPTFADRWAVAYGSDYFISDLHGSSTTSQESRQVLYDNPKYVNPGPLTTINTRCPPRPSTAEELAKIKRDYDEAEGEVLTVRSKDHKAILHIKVSE